MRRKSSPTERFDFREDFFEFTPTEKGLGVPIDVPYEEEDDDEDDEEIFIDSEDDG